MHMIEKFYNESLSVNDKVSFTMISHVLIIIDIFIF